MSRKSHCIVILASRQGRRAFRVAVTVEIMMQRRVKKFMRMVVGKVRME